MTNPREVDPTIINIASAVRAAIEKLYPHRKGGQNLCSLSAYAVVKLCAEFHVDAEVMGGTFRFVPEIGRLKFGDAEHIKAKHGRSPEPHAWVRHHANFIDITLTQFDPDAPKVAVLEESDARYKGKAESLEYIEIILPFIGWDRAHLSGIVNAARSLYGGATERS